MTKLKKITVFISLFCGILSLVACYYISWCPPNERWSGEVANLYYRITDRFDVLSSKQYYTFFAAASLFLIFIILATSIKKRKKLFFSLAGGILIGYLGLEFGWLHSYSSLSATFYNCMKCEGTNISLFGLYDGNGYSTSTHYTDGICYIVTKPMATDFCDSICSHGESYTEKKTHITVAPNHWIKTDPTKGPFRAILSCQKYIHNPVLKDLLEPYKDSVGKYGLDPVHQTFYDVYDNVLRYGVQKSTRKIKNSTDLENLFLEIAADCYSCILDHMDDTTYSGWNIWPKMHEIGKTCKEKLKGN